MQQTVLTAPNISCDHCKMTIEAAGNALDGVNSITVDTPAKRIEVSYDDSVVSLDEIKKVLEGAGYPAE